MFGSMALELAISMVFVYLLLSLLCTAINEWIAGLMALRPKTLEQGIRNLLNDRTGTGFAKRLYDHPLIRGCPNRVINLPIFPRASLLWPFWT